MALKLQDYKTDIHNNWCPGCGDFGVLNSLQMSLSEMQLEPHRVAIFSGIGCSGKTTQYMDTYGIHTLHGRLLPFAIGAKLANPELEVFAVGGDGDGFGIGGGHFVNAGRRNVDLTYVVYDNMVYGLTKGQASPTLKLGSKTKSLPQPNINEAVNPLLLAFAAGYTFIARGYSFDVKHTKELIKLAMQHKGLAFVDILQPCPTYNDLNTKEWYAGEDLEKNLPRVYKVEEEGYDPVISTGEGFSAKAAKFIAKATEWGDRIPLGVLYKNEAVSTYEERYARRIPTFLKDPPAKQIISNSEKKTVVDFTKFFEEFRATSGERTYSQQDDSWSSA